jgi:hypothetical protein
MKNSGKEVGTTTGFLSKGKSDKKNDWPTHLEQSIRAGLLQKSDYWDLRDYDYSYKVIESDGGHKFCAVAHSSTGKLIGYNIVTQIKEAGHNIERFQFGGNVILVREESNSISPNVIALKYEEALEVWKKFLSDKRRREAEIEDYLNRYVENQKAVRASKKVHQEIKQRYKEVGELVKKKLSAHKSYADMLKDKELGELLHELNNLYLIMGRYRIVHRMVNTPLADYFGEEWPKKVK